MPGKWLLVFFCPDNNDVSLRWQLKELDLYRDDLLKREVVYHLEHPSDRHSKLLSPEQVSGLKAGYKINGKQFHTLLINNNNEVIFSAARAVALQELIVVIDIARLHI